MTENKEKAQMQIKKHVHSVIVDDDKNTQLHHAAAAGNKEDVKRCLVDEKNVDAQNYLGWTPLMMACRKGRSEVAEMLLEHRADASKKNRFGINVFLLTIASGDLKLVKLILQHLLSGGLSRNSLQHIFSPLSVAILFQHQDILNHLISRSFHLDAATPITHITPLMFAAAMENSEAFMELLRQGADGTLKNYLGHTAYDIPTLRKQIINAANQEQLPPVVPFSPNLQLLNQHSFQNGSHQCPSIVISQYPSFIVPESNPHLQLRKSSFTSPFFVPSPPNVTPITPMSYVPQPHSQIFFPPDFSPNHVMANPYAQTNLLDTRINFSGAYFSPQVMKFLSPTV